MKRVVIAEKRSVAVMLAKALGGYRERDGALVKGDTAITWAVGHLVELKMPHEYDPALKKWRLETLPFVPAALRLKVIADRRERFAAVKQVLRGAERVINACDAGREGELIFRRILRQVKYSGRVERLWISSYTDASIRQGFQNLRPSSDYEGLYQSARVRSEGDWIVGLNGTRAMTVRHGRGVLLTVGRVQTPVLAGIVERERAIRDFVPEPYWLVRGDFVLGSGDRGDGGGRYRGLWFKPGGEAELEEEEEKPKGGKKGKGRKGATEEEKAPRASWIRSREEAEAIAGRVMGRPGLVLSAATKERSEPPPYLFDLTALQRMAHLRYRYTAKETLGLAQALYEKHKLITYPRTDSCFITKDLVSSLPGRLEAAASLSSLRAFVPPLLAGPLRPGRRVVNDAKVTDHHALLPTEIDPSGRSLSEREGRIYEMVARQLIAALMPAARWLDTRVITRVESAEHRDDFLTRGRILAEAGWRALIPPRNRDRVLPSLSADAAVEVADTEIKDEQTRPPPRYSEASLLKFMETAGRGIEEDALRAAMREHGLGTPATRAEIIEKLKRQCYVRSEGKSLAPTLLGERLIELIPLELIKSPTMTGQWEKRIHDVQRDPALSEAFRDEIVGMTDALIAAVRDSTPAGSELQELAERSGRPADRFAARRDGGRTSRGGRSASSSRASSSRASSSRASPSRTASRASKARASSSSGAEVRKPARARSKASKGGGSPVGTPLGPCPRCKTGTVIVGQRDYGCGRWREGCRFVLRRAAPYGRTLSEAQAKGLLDKGRTRPLTLKSGGSSFKGRFILQGESLSLERIA